MKIFRQILKKTFRFIKAFSKVLISSLFIFLSFFIKRYDNYIALGSWMGERYADNSKYLAKHVVRNYPKFKVFWVGNLSIKEEVIADEPKIHFLEKGKLTTYFTLLRCKYFFFTQMHNADIADINLFKGATLCYLHHGMPIKKWASDGLNQTINTGRGLKKIYNNIRGLNINYQYFITSSPLHDYTNCSALKLKGCVPSKNVHSGTPRNDMLINHEKGIDIALKKKYADIIGFDESKKIILYLPTYRRLKNNTFSFLTLKENQLEVIQTILKQNNAIIIEKNHFGDLSTENPYINSSNIFHVERRLEVQELLLFSDMLISDYSGAFLDYVLLDRPIIHYAYDYEFYRDFDSGLYYDINDFSAGKIAYTFNEMVDELSKLFSNKDLFSEKRQYVRNKYMAYEKGKASEKIVQEVILKNKQ